MEIYSIDFTPTELSFIRQALDVVMVQGKDARFVISLQAKIEHELNEIQKMKQAEELKKMEGLKKLQ
jgi:hypothetical protein